MSKAGVRAEKSSVKELEPFDKKRIDVTKFEPELPVKKRIEFLKFPAGLKLSWLVIDSLGIARTVGKGRTNLTFIRSTIVQADATTPRASFDRTKSPDRNPVIQMHFEPAAYGMTAPSSYFMNFSVECFGQTTFNVQAFAGAGTLTNTGTKTVSGQVVVSIGFHNVPAGQQTFGFLEQTGGAPWDFFVVDTSLPFPVVFLP